MLRRGHWPANAGDSDGPAGDSAHGQPVRAARLASSTLIPSGIAPLLRVAGRVNHVVTRTNASLPPVAAGQNPAEIMSGQESIQIPQVTAAGVEFKVGRLGLDVFE